MRVDRDFAHLANAMRSLSHAWHSHDVTCSTDPEHGPGDWNDFTARKRAREFFADPRVASLAEAAGADDLPRIASLIHQGADPNLSNADGRSAVHDAAAADDIAFLAALIAHRADLNQEISNDGNTPLMLTLMAKCDKQMNMLLRSGANPLARNKVGATFQTYLNLGPPPDNLADGTKRGMLEIHTWLQEHQVPVEVPPPRKIMPWERHPPSQ